MSTPLREHDIRPADTTAEQRRRYEADVARLLERRGEFVDVACPACGRAPRSLRFEKYSLTFHECAGCGTVYVSPRPPPAVLKDYYEHSLNYAYWNSVIFPASEAVRRERIFRPRVERLVDLCSRHGVARDVLVEVGAGFGTFCEELRARRAFERILAIEPTPELAATCRARGLAVIESRIEDVDLAGAADVVVAFEVIEHLFDPRAFVRLAARVLKPRGMLVLTCPNVHGFDIDVLGAGSPAIDAEHLNYFHPRSLGELLRSEGFAVLESQTPGKLDADIVRNRVLAGEFTLADRFLRRVLLDDWERLGGPFQSFLVESGLSSNMWVAGRRERD
ncbi:MAG TPA: class I SAM-dependent methyltransferase [Polyangiaceae bacterium]|nr:class I SAM-dependent methyltransferase [Polyangiaceae bacterium]